ncbi:MAG: glycine cleavage system aminomethyltransferase GcvT [Myxococcales bacterium]|nr:glycine cleavage system aminomethyltransferase GcvT [Myxococcales bacterium]
MSDAPLRRTPLDAEHEALGARLVPFAGWRMPLHYPDGIVREHHAVRRHAGLFDVSHMGELWVRGPDAVEVVDRIVTNDIGRLADGRARYTVACNERGTILDDLIVYRVAADELLIVCNASNREKMAGVVRAAASGRSAEVDDATERTGLLALQGPHAFDVLAKAGAPSELVSMPSFSIRRALLAGVDVWIARTGYTGEDGVEIVCPWESTVAVWRALLAAGAVPVGLGARDTLRLEARLALYGNEIDETTTPWEAGLGWVVKLDKGEFTGREALAQARRRPLERTLVGFEMTGRGIARHGYQILDEDGAVVGVVTSGGPAPSLDRNIGLGYVPPRLSDIGTALRIDVRGKPVDAVVVRTPFYVRPREPAAP